MSEPQRQVLDQRIALESCVLCPRQCRVNRLIGRTGYCQAGRDAEVYRYAPHFGEEPPISGSKGSGTIFFGRCTLECLYCQNYPWSQEGTASGKVYDLQGLTGILTALYKQGCHNWNLVSPTPWLPQIISAIDLLKQDGFRLPVVYNVSGFEKAETIQALNGIVDVFLTDLRYSKAESALEGSGSAIYAEVARQALTEMWTQAGALQTDDQGIAQKGVICRILILPGRSQEAVENIRWIADTLGTDVALSVMAQYLPAHRAGDGNIDPVWNRRITLSEYQPVCEAVSDCGFENGWIQDFDSETPDELIGFEMKSS